MNNDGFSYPPALDFATVNDWVHDTDRHYEELVCACLGMATEIERLRAELDDMKEKCGEYIERIAEERRRVVSQSGMTATARKERDALRAELDALKGQEPVAWVRCRDRHRRRKLSFEKPVASSPDTANWSPLYLRPTPPAPSVPEDVMRDAERYRYLRARDEGTAGVGCWIEAEGRACDRGWLYGDQLDSAIDSFIEMLAAAPEAKP